MLDEKLKEFANERQVQYIDAYNTHGSYTKAAKALGVTRNAVIQSVQAVIRRAGIQGYSPDHDMVRTVPDGYIVKGVSTYYDKEGNPSGQWVKSSVDLDRLNEIYQEAANAFAAELPKLPEIKTARRPVYNNNLLSVYPIGDAHIGMMAWDKEAGDNWDIKKIERVQCKAMDMLVSLAPNTEKAVIINLGDWFHYDNMDATTSRNGHRLDTDSRYGKIVAVGIKVMRRCIESALAKHNHVRVINVIGNHDDTGAIWLSTALKHIYANNRRVEIDDNPSAFSYFEFGKVLVGCHHGHTCKPERLPGVMATDKAQSWGRSKHRYWYIGHVHHQSVKEYSGVSVESFNTLIARDAYATSGGYRSRQNMKCIVLHKEHGEVCRHTVSPDMIR